MNISIIGSGNLAWFMALRLKVSGHKIVEVFSRKEAHAKELAERLNARPVVNIKDMCSDADVFIFAVPDGIIEELSKQFPHKNKTCIHCAGTVGIDILPGANTGVIWPLYSINKNNMPEGREIPLFWEAKGAKARNYIPQLATAISDSVQEADLSKRDELHLSAVFVNNFVNHLMAITQERMKQLNLPFNESLEPVIQGTIRAAMEGRSSVSQTGAAIRGDKQTMEKHLHLLSTHPEWQQIYRAISDSIQIFYSAEK